MAQIETSYTLYNSVTKSQSAAMDLESAKKAISEVSKVDLVVWFVWKPTWTDWSPVLQVEELFAKSEAPKAMMPPPPPQAPTAKQQAETARAFEERRRHPRHEVRLRVIIRNEQLTFRTFSKDVSLGGIWLENAIPERLFESDCHIFIASPDQSENIRFTLKATSRNDLAHFSFSNLEPSSVDKLSSWLKQNTNRRKVA